jgi:hypothetical protein
MEMVLPFSVELLSRKPVSRFHDRIGFPGMQIQTQEKQRFLPGDSGKVTRTIQYALNPW